MFEDRIRKYKETRYDYALIRARFRGRSPCLMCNDVGVVRIKVEDLGTLIKCSCEFGKDQIWALPSISEMRPGTFEQAPLPAEQFSPPFKPKTQTGALSFIKEKISWWKEKVRMAEEYWSNNPLEVNSTVLRRDPYAD